MTLQQIRCFYEVVTQGLNLSRAARAMNTSQPAVTKMIRSLEKELGVDLLLRAGPRIVGITDGAKPLLEQAKLVLNSVQNFQLSASDSRNSDTGELRIATTHVHVRYALVNVIKRLGTRYPLVDIDVAEGSPREIAEWVHTGRVDAGLSTMADVLPSQLFHVDAYPVRRCLLVQQGHPLLKKRKLTLADIARYPLIATRSHTGAAVDQVFRQAHISTRTRIKVPTVDAAKTYVAAGLGIAVTHAIAVSREDRAIRAIKVDHLFPSPTAFIILRRDQYFRKVLYDFIEMLAPKWGRDAVERARLAK